jgi:hypothetical protein
MLLFVDNNLKLGIRHSKVGIHFADKRRWLGLYISLADLDHVVFFLCFRFYVQKCFVCNVK